MGPCKRAVVIQLLSGVSRAVGAIGKAREAVTRERGLVEATYSTRA